MIFKDRSLVNGLQADEDGVTGISLRWACTGMREMDTKGFIVCYRSGAAHEQCRAAVEAFTDEQLLQALSFGRPLTEMRAGSDMLICTTAQAGLHMLNDYFAAPSVIEVWAVLYHRESGTLFVCDHTGKDNSFTRKLRLVIGKESRFLGGGGLRSRQRPGTVIRVTKPECTARYIDGMVEYRLIGDYLQRYAYPIAAEAIGQELCFPDIPPEYIQVGIAEEYRDMCTPEYR